MLFVNHIVAWLQVKRVHLPTATPARKGLTPLATVLNGTAQHLGLGENSKFRGLTHESRVRGGRGHGDGGRRRRSLDHRFKVRWDVRTRKHLDKPLARAFTFREHVHVPLARNVVAHVSEHRFNIACVTARFAGVDRDVVIRDLH